MIISKTVWIAVTLMCQVSYKTRDAQRCHIMQSEISKTEKECLSKKRMSEKCVEFKAGEFLIVYDIYPGNSK